MLRDLKHHVGQRHLVSIVLAERVAGELVHAHAVPIEAHHRKPRLSEGLVHGARQRHVRRVRVEDRVPREHEHGNRSLRHTLRPVPHHGLQAANVHLVDLELSAPAGVPQVLQELQGGHGVGLLARRHELLSVDAQRDPPHHRSVPQDEVVLDPVAGTVLLDDHGAGGEALGGLRRGDLPPAADDDAALVRSADDLPVVHVRGSHG
mmetsp:Transcript_5895/g.18906  ORF Transcript_5895/g.18906 Transcript_5895/m.18906 type:complete len:206 (-) Transcript_5895:72-689(-)